MAKQKKKSNNHQADKQLAAQCRSAFFGKMKHIIDNVCGTDIYPLIPPETLNLIYLYRNTPFKIMAAPNHKIPPIYLIDMKAILPNILKRETITLSPSTFEVTLADYYTVVLTIYNLITHINALHFKQSDKVKAALNQCIDRDAIFEKSSFQLHLVLHGFHHLESNMGKLLYWSIHKIVPPKTHPAKIENVIQMYCVSPEVINVRLEEGTRPARRVGWVHDNIEPTWLSIKPADLGYKSPFAETPLKVYIQTHALNRLAERIDCFWPGIVHQQLFYSLLNPKIAYDTNKRLLIEFSFFGNKAGYIRADLVEGIILLRTFLFVTNSGTPEGQLLEKNTGLQKLDKKYLNIDKLSTFMNSDLDQNIEVQRLFKDSNCKCLIDLYNNTKPLLIKKENQFSFNHMLSYINVNKTETPTNTPQTVELQENN